MVGGQELRVVQGDSVDANSRKMLALEFDLAEMSLATFLAAKFLERKPLIALPLFTGRRLPHDAMYVAADSKIDDPSALEGSRVAVPQYWMTSSVWHRGILREQYGVDWRRITWFTTQNERSSKLPDADVELVTGASPAHLLLEGTVDAVLLPKPNAELASIGRPLIRDREADERRCLESLAAIPIMHLVIMRSDVGEGANDLLRAVASLLKVVDVSPGDPALRAFLRFVNEQGLIDRIPDLSEFLLDPADGERIST